MQFNQLFAYNKLVVLYICYKLATRSDKS